MIVNDYKCNGHYWHMELQQQSYFEVKKHKKQLHFLVASARTL